MKKESILKGMEPERVLYYFEEICGIPHGSYHIKEISDYLAGFAKEHGLTFVQDKAGNVIIFKDASAGCEGAPALILQGHMDMVLEKEPENPINMEKEPITLIVDGDILHADRTTLGGDDGIAVAMMLALLEDDTIKHPALECIFTVNEEVGMEGAQVLDVSPLEGRIMLNLDSELEGIFTAGCAGGAEMILSVPAKERKPRTGKLARIHVEGLIGGHSGIAINQGRANADILLGRVLYTIYKNTPFYLVSAAGGNKDNAIPRTADAQILLPEEADMRGIKKLVETLADNISHEYHATDPDVKISFTAEKESSEEVLSFKKKDTRKLIHILQVIPNGLIESDPHIADMPQTSLNLGILDARSETILVDTLVRSSINSQRKMLMDRIFSLAEMVDATVEVRGEYPAWEYNETSAFRDRLVALYEKMNGKKPEISITHGGLECGLLAAKLEGLDCVSLGPDMVDIHTPSERLSISSAKRLWDFVKAAVEELAEA